MQLKLVQIKKELFSADFSIVDCLSGDVVGHMSFSNQPESEKLCAQWIGEFLGARIRLDFNIKSTVLSQIDNSFRPCEIFYDDQKLGSVYQRTQKSGWFSSYSFIAMNYRDNEYAMYPIGHGKNGIKNPVYLGDEQVAQIEKDMIVIDDLHKFDIYVSDESSVVASVIFSCYMYTIAYYKYGVKVKSSVEKYYTKTTNKHLLSKFNPNYKKENF